MFETSSVLLCHYSLCFVPASLPFSCLSWSPLVLCFSGFCGLFDSGTIHFVLALLLCFRLISSDLLLAPPLQAQHARTIGPNDCGPSCPTSPGSSRNKSETQTARAAPRELPSSSSRSPYNLAKAQCASLRLLPQRKWKDAQGITRTYKNHKQNDQERAKMAKMAKSKADPCWSAKMRTSVGI